MRIRVLSDLHVEFARFVPPAAPADVVVIAGDVHPGLASVEWIRQAFPETPVVFVLGNHELYRFATPKLVDDVRAFCAGTNIRFLENEAAEIGGVRFLGGSLWTDFKLFGTPQITGGHAAATMNDYRLIRVSPAFRKLKGLDTARMHAATRKWLEDAFREPFSGPTVVVTHHAPSTHSLAANWESDQISAAYASALDDLVAASGAALWVHGHTHIPVDYRIGKTRVLSNPRGYPGGVPSGFDPSLVVELSP